MPFGPGDDIRKAATELLRMDDGFVVFDDGDDLEYVQYSSDGKELILNWPANGPRVASTAGEVVENFTTAAFERVYRRLGLQKLNARVGV